MTPPPPRRGAGPQAHREIDARWRPACPMALPQRPRACLGYYERGPGRLQIRFLARDDEGVCDVVVDEDATRVVLRLLVCQGEEHLGYPGLAEEREHVELAEPLGGRTVIDFETAEPMPLYVPTWWDNRQTTAPGFYDDPAEARDAWQLLPEGVERDGPPIRSPWRLRTLGY